MIRRFHNHLLFRISAAISTCLLVYLTILWSGVFAGTGFYLRYDTLFLPLGLGMIFMLLKCLSPQLAFFSMTFLSTTICGMVLSGIWTEAVSDFSVMVGLYPHADALSYLRDAIGLLHGNELSGFSSRRPLSSGFWSVLLFLGGGNIKFALAAMVFITSLSLAMPSREVARTHGWFAAYVMFVGLLLFYQRIIGTGLHEHLGLMLACIAFAYIWRSAQLHLLTFALAGIFVLSLSLNARAGAFFILPMLAIWAGFAWRESSRFSFKVFASACLAFIAGFVLNGVVLYSIGQPSAHQGNFSYMLYGLAHGGDWSRVYRDIPELKSLTEQERNRTIYALARKQMEDNPSGVARGILKAYRSFFLSTEGAYSFVNFALQRSILQLTPKPSMQQISSTKGFSGVMKELQKNPLKYVYIASTFLMFVLLSILAAGGVLVLLKTHASTHILLAYAGLGIVASVPFAPPWHADLMRAYAATLPFMCAFPAVGCTQLLTLLKKKTVNAASKDEWPGTSKAGLALFIMLLVFVIGLFPILIIKAFPQERLRSEDRADIWRLKIVPGSVVSLNPDDVGSRWSSSVSLSKVYRNLGVFAINPEEHDDVSQIRAFAPGQTLVMCFEDTKKNSLRYLVMEKEQLRRCGKGWFFAETRPFLTDHPTGRWWKIININP